MTFGGWPEVGLEWLEEIRVHNDRAWFAEHRSTYETAVRQPMVDLFEALAAEFGPGRVFRPHRDVRFSKDKTPYQTHVAGMTEDEGGSHFYAQLSSEGLMAASGMYRMASDQLERFRSALDAPAGAALEGVVAALRAEGHTVGGSSLKTAPRGWSKDHPRIALLRHKGVYISASAKPGRWLHGPKAKDRVVATWRAAAPLNAWLAQHVGPSEQPPESWG